MTTSSALEEKGTVDLPSQALVCPSCGWTTLPEEHPGGPRATICAPCMVERGTPVALRFHDGHAFAFGDGCAEIGTHRGTLPA